MGSEFAEPEKRPEQKQSVPTNRQSFSSSQSTHKIQPVRPVQKHTPPEERQKIMDELAQRVTDWRKPTRMRDLFDAPSTQQPSPIAPEHESSLPTAMPSVKPEPTIVATTNLTPGMLQQSTQETKSAANAPLASRSAPSDPKQLIAQAKPESEDAWLNTGIASKGGPERMPFDGRIVRTDRNGKQTIIPVKYGQIVQQQAGDQLQYYMPTGNGAKKQLTPQEQRDEAIKKMSYGDKLSDAAKMVPDLLKGDAKAAYQKMVSDPGFVAQLVGVSAAFAALQLTPAAPLVDITLIATLGFSAGFDLGSFLVKTGGAKDEKSLKEAATYLKDLVETVGITAIAGTLRTAGRLMAQLKKAEIAEAGTIRNVNPGWPKAAGRTNNCVNCSIATDATLAGRPASALRGNNTPINVLEKIYNNKFTRMKSQEAITSKMAEAGPGARGIVYVIYDTIPPSAHVFNVVNQGGTIRFLDGQVGGKASFDRVVHMRLMQTK